MSSLQWQRTADGLPEHDCESKCWWVSNASMPIPVITRPLPDLFEWKYYCAHPMIAPPPEPKSKLVKYLERHIKLEAHGELPYTEFARVEGVLAMLLHKAKNGDFDKEGAQV